MARIGEAAGTARLLEAVGGNGLNEQIFLLGVLREIDDRSALDALARHLADDRAIAGGVPSGAQPQRRLKDFALEAFVAKLALSPSFALTPSRRYGEAQIAEVRAAVKRSLTAR